MKQLLKSLPTLGLAIGLAGHAWAQPAGQTNYLWNAAGDKTSWIDGANWVQGAPPPPDGTVYQINLGDFSADSPTPIEIPPTNLVVISDSTFGPMWGQTLDIFGSYTCGFGMFAWGALNGPVSTLNVHTNALFSCQDTLALGTAWWFPAGPNVVMNVYTNARVGIGWMQFGAKLNLYGGTVVVTNGFNTGSAASPVFSGGLDTDATRAINLTYGSTLVLPASYTATVNDWISRGILQVYGVPGDGAEIVVDEANATWPGTTVVTTTATHANPIVAVYLQVPRTHLSVGGLQYAQVYADYSITTNVNVTTTPGINIVYQSSATNVATITAAGQVRAVGPGQASLWAIVGNFSNSVALHVTLYTNTATLIHRYSFAESPGDATAADSVGGPDWDGTLNGGATFTGDGQLALDGTSGMVQLPAGLLTNMDAVTIETWASFGTISSWAMLWSFGDSDGTYGHNYVSFQPHTGATPPTAQSGIKNAVTEQNPWFYPVLDNYTNLHIVAVYHPEAGYCSIYTNGVLATINSSITVTLLDAMSTGDPLNYIGHSLYINDPYLPVYLNEFRIYQGPLTVGQIQADAALGPDQLIGTNTTVLLAAQRAGATFRLQWPTNSALVSLMTSSTLGRTASWSPVVAPLTIVGTNFLSTLPLSASAQFFRLQ